jgi:hypothetical protein
MIKDYIESMILAAQQSNHVVTFDDRGDLRIESILDSIAKDKMISYDLIKQDDKGRWILNRRGLNFKSFKDEDLKRRIEHHPYRKDLLIIFISAGLSLLSGYMLWRISNQPNQQEIKELQEKVDKVTYRLDSITNSQIYQQHVQDSAKHK